MIVQYLLWPLGLQPRLSPGRPRSLRFLAAPAHDSGVSDFVEVREGRRDEQREWRRNWQRGRRGDWRNDRRHWRRHHDRRGRPVYVVPCGYGYPYGYAPYGYFAPRPGVTFQFGL